jgi:GT2 family glycosyltransferase
MVKLLIGGPIHQKPAILKEFLISLKELDLRGLDVSYYFIDDNLNMDSSYILNEFKVEAKNVRIEKSTNKSLYICDSINHKWTNSLIKKVTRFKNEIIEKALEEKFDYLFLVDSDIVMHPNTLKRLRLLNKEIISNIFWTKWEPDSEPYPQVWLKDNYTLYNTNQGESISNIEASNRVKEFLSMLKKPGTYEVGGLGACTLISRSALEKGVNFNPVYNLSFMGEDRHFCVRAAVLGIQLYVDTMYPAYHIYRTEDLNNLYKYKIENLHNR